MALAQSWVFPNWVYPKGNGMAIPPLKSFDKGPSNSEPPPRNNRDPFCKSCADDSDNGGNLESSHSDCNHYQTYSVEDLYGTFSYDL